MKTNNIKGTFYYLTLGTFLVLNLIYCFSFNGLDWQEVDVTKLIYPSMLGIIALAVTGLVPTGVKEFLVFKRIKNRLPSYRAFSEKTLRGGRINLKSLRSVHGKLPTDPKKMNTLWYTIYQKHKNAPEVFEAHRAFLILRDVSVISFLFLIALIIFKLLDIKMNTYSIQINAFLYILASTSSLNYGNRFVANVLALESHSST